MDAAVQTVEILEKIDQLLSACGSSKSHILQATVTETLQCVGVVLISKMLLQIWLADMRYLTQMNAVWDAWVDQENAPVRACVEARLANPSLLVEMQVTAAQIV